MPGFPAPSTLDTYWDAHGRSLLSALAAQLQRGAFRHADYAWASGARHRDLAALLAAEAARPTFGAFPALAAPALARVWPVGGDMSRRAALRTDADAADLLAWGFAPGPGGSGSESAAVAEVSLAAAAAAAGEGYAPLDGGLGLFGLPPAEGAARRAGAARRMREALAVALGGEAGDAAAWEGGVERGAEAASEGGGAASEGGAAGGGGPAGRFESVGCPVGIWDEPPNDWWHPLAGRICRAVWDGYAARLAAAAGCGAGGGGAA